MLLEILAVGRMKNGPEQELYDRYADRLSKSGRALHLAGPQLKVLQESRAANPETRKSEEAEALLGKISAGNRLILLDEAGKDISSTELSELIFSEQEAGTQTLSFAIGGPDGHGTEMRKRAFRSIRFGSVTWPHQMVRVMLAEQLYRSVTIRSGHPYHRD